MRINEFVSTLPSNIISGDRVIIPDDFIRRMFILSSLNKSDVFYHLGIGNNPSSLLIAKKEFMVRKAVGIDIDPVILDEISTRTRGIEDIFLVEGDATKYPIAEATVIFSWFTDEKINEILIKKFESELGNGSKILSIWSPPGLYLPDKIDFPILLCQKPLKTGNDIRDQLKSIYKSDCIDFTASWNLADKYIKSFGTVDSSYVRFLIILHSLIIWFNARDLGITCEDDIPPPVKSYVEIMKYFFNIDLGEFLFK
ncbi:SAM-dependent methyltransferase [Candidatus Nitrosocosmicus hydrocola]|uniref:SAM-dependent methyltransferase n=1 Tax=Candidatus Nitrosocosmicus hydrocola TaxID=1826872 RepID=UPI0011E5D64C|nr:SAM-dependent methyltransferase [Candidatus Nitrosocosmicus hydrocola]